MAEKLGIHSVHVSFCPIFLPSPHHRPQPLPGRPLPPDVTEAIRAQGRRALVAHGWAGTIRTDGAPVAARLLVDAVSRERPPVPA